ncbi:MAG: hypothetical protein EBW14_10695, partial [Oxalobacteraceae bacterium]|nr:hypothetical protein [Oxalobacteraceae bacterium]
NNEWINKPKKLKFEIDKKLLNTLKVVNYDTEKQRITMIRGFEIKRVQDGTLKWGFSVKKPKTDITRKKKKVEGSFFDDLSPHTRQAIGAIIFVVLAVFFVPVFFVVVRSIFKGNERQRKLYAAHMAEASKEP